MSLSGDLAQPVVNAAEKAAENVISFSISELPVVLATLLEALSGYKVTIQLEKK